MTSDVEDLCICIFLRSVLFTVCYAPFQIFSMLSIYVHICMCICVHIYIHIDAFTNSIYSILKFNKPKSKKILNGVYIVEEL